jgi:hypothetical protein
MSDIEKAFFDTYNKEPTTVELAQFRPYYAVRRATVTERDYHAIIQRIPTDVRWVKEAAIKRHGTRHGTDARA